MRRLLMAEPDGDITVEPAHWRRLWTSGRGRALLAAIVVTALVGTGFGAYRWGSATSSDPVTARPTASPEASRPPTVAEIYATLRPSLVSIKATSKSSAATGTGVIVNADGTVLTALHVVQGATAVELTYADGTRSAAKVAATDKTSDIALLAPATLPSVVVPAVLGGSGLSVGDQVVAIGNQLGLTGSTTTGVVSGLDRSIARDGGGTLKGLIQFDAAVNPGSSGGPLVNAEGATIGIVVALANPTEAGTFIGIGFAVPIGTAVRAGADRPPQV
jgi:putative serine protease PepD